MKINMHSETEEQDEETGFGSQNLFSSQSFSPSPAPTTKSLASDHPNPEVMDKCNIPLVSEETKSELDKDKQQKTKDKALKAQETIQTIPQCQVWHPAAVVNNPYTSVKAILQMLQLYQMELHRAQARVGSQMDWVAIEGIASSSDGLHTFHQGNVMKNLQQCASENSDSCEKVTTRGMKGTEKINKVSPKVSEMFKFKITGGDDTSQASVTVGTAGDTEKCIGKTTKLAMLKKGTKWLKSKIGLKRKTEDSSDSDENILVDEPESKKMKEGIDTETARSKICRMNEKIDDETREEGNHTRIAISDRLSARPKQTNEYSVTDVEEDSDTPGDKAETLRDNGIVESVYLEDDAEEEVVTLRKQKLKRSLAREERIACPLCNREFSPSVINEHAFQCDGEPKTREQRPQSNKINNLRSNAADYQNSKCKNEADADLVKDKSFKLFESVSKKMSVPKENENETAVSKKKSGNGKCKTTKEISPIPVVKIGDVNQRKIGSTFITVLGKVKEDKAVIAVEEKSTFDIKQNNLELKVSKKKRIVSKIAKLGIDHAKSGDDHTKPSNDDAKPANDHVKVGNDHSMPGNDCGNPEAEHWISDEVNDTQNLDTTSDIMQQYMKTSPASDIRHEKKIQKTENTTTPGAKKVTTKRGKRMEKCFLCGKHFAAGDAYRKHVEEEADLMESKERSFSKKRSRNGIAKEIDKLDVGLSSKLGNRDSWSQVQLLHRNGDNDVSEMLTDVSETDSITVENVSDSPIKNFKLIDENSTFDFNGQFNSNRPHRNSKPRKTSSSKWKGFKKRKKF